MAGHRKYDWPYGHEEFLRWATLERRSLQFMADHCGVPVRAVEAKLITLDIHRAPKFNAECRGYQVATRLHEGTYMALRRRVNAVGHNFSDYIRILIERDLNNVLPQHSIRATAVKTMDMLESGGNG